ncbi:MAG: hypothetical protein IT350_05765 [Deltaproteobacteria bacterium]|nr:hypothetical protein [Deltaproteobacteria bacterium]
MKLEKILWLALVASLVLALGSVVACGDDDDDDDDDATGDDDDDDDDAADDDSTGDDDDDAVSECEAWYTECGVDDAGYCDSLGSYVGLGECWDAAIANLFDCLVGAGCSDSEAIGACSSEFVSAISGC